MQLLRQHADSLVCCWYQRSCLLPHPFSPLQFGCPQVVECTCSFPSACGTKCYVCTDIHIYFKYYYFFFSMMWTQSYVFMLKMLINFLIIFSRLHTKGILHHIKITNRCSPWTILLGLNITLPLSSNS